MKLFRSAAFVIIFISAAAAGYSQDRFEGNVEYKISSGDQTTMMSYSIKDHMIKMDMKSGEEASMIFDTKEKKMFIMMPAQKMYMEMPVNLDAVQKEGNEKMTGEFKETGETKEIMGYTAEKWIYKDEANEITAWLTKDLGSFLFMDNPMANSGGKPAWQIKLEEGGYFPMEVIIKEGSDDETRMETTKIEKKELSMDLFTLPADYQKLDMPMNQQK